MSQKSRIKLDCLYWREFWITQQTQYKWVNLPGDGLFIPLAIMGEFRGKRTIKALWWTWRHLQLTQIQLLFCLSFILWQRSLIVGGLISCPRPAKADRSWWACLNTWFFHEHRRGVKLSPRLYPVFFRRRYKSASLFGTHWSWKGQW